MARIEFQSGGEVIRRRRLRPGQGRLVLGRSDTADEWLAGEGVSRIHALLDPRDEGWWIVDRSRNGTYVNGAQVTRHLLEDGDEVSIGQNRFWFREPRSVSDARGRAHGSTTRQIRPVTHEEPVAIDEDGVTMARAELTFVRGPRDGERLVLDGAVTHVGGGADDDLLLDGLPRRAFTIQVIRGRPMVSPGHAVPQVGGRPVPGTMPVYNSEVVSLGEHAFELRTTFTAVREERASFGELVGSSPSMRALFGTLARIASHDHPVLLTGESGTGKELTARALHGEGLRAGMPFEPVNCAALTDTLVESQLFGHVKGAFTGATDDQPGAFQRADRGTLFLDEIGELKADAQAKLLRALESSEVRRVGGRHPEYPDVRIIAATNRDLPAMVRDGRFRGDLFFRLSVLTVRMPPLRERTSDIPHIAETLLRRELPGASLDPGAIERLQEHDWPGNVRELRNVLTRARVLGGPHITPASLSFNALPGGEGPLASEPMSEDERRIVDAMHAAEGNKAKAARILGIPRSSLLYRLKKYRID